MTHLNPFVLLCYFAAVAGISMFSMNPIIQIVSLAGAMSFFFVRNAGKKTGMHLPLFFDCASGCGAESSVSAQRRDGSLCFERKSCYEGSLYLRRGCRADVVGNALLVPKLF